MQTTETYSTDNLTMRVALEEQERVYVVLGLTNFNPQKYRNVPMSLQVLFDRPNERVVYFLMNDNNNSVAQKIGIDYYAVADVATNVPMPPVMGTIHALNKRFSMKKPYVDQKEIQRAGLYLNEHLMEMIQIMELEFAKFNPFAPALYEEFQRLNEEQDALKKAKVKG